MPYPFAVSLAWRSGYIQWRVRETPFDHAELCTNHDDGDYYGAARFSGPDIPISYNGFVYVISGSVRIGEHAVPLRTGQVGWLGRFKGEGMSVLRAETGESGARLVLYAGQPQGDPIVSHGPFIGDSKEDKRFSTIAGQTTATARLESWL